MKFIVNKGSMIEDNTIIIKRKLTMQGRHTSLVKTEERQKTDDMRYCFSEKGRYHLPSKVGHPQQQALSLKTI